MIASSAMAAAAVIQYLATLTLLPELLIAGRSLCAFFSPLCDAALILYLQVGSDKSGHYEINKRRFVVVDRLPVVHRVKAGHIYNLHSSSIGAEVMLLYGSTESFWIRKKYLKVAKVPSSKV